MARMPPAASTSAPACCTTPPSGPTTAPRAHTLLTERLRLLRWEQQQAAQRLRQIHEFQAASADPAERRAVESELAWAQDYYARISSRITELRRRVAELEQRAATLSDRASARPWDPWVAPLRGPRPKPRPPSSTPPRPPPRRPRRRRPGGRAGQGRQAPPSRQCPLRGHRRRGRRRDRPRQPRPGCRARAVPARSPLLRAPASAATATSVAPAASMEPAADVAAAVPRGARFAGAAAPAPAPAAPVVDDADREAVSHTVDLLRHLRADGRGGQAHAVLVEAAHGPAERLPLLARRLEAAGLATDWTTLLWEAAALPPEDVLSAAEHLTDGAVRRTGADCCARAWRGLPPPSATPSCG
ncbi:hypothetical protein ACFQZC_03210 [Streptacidiphilus monticola]